MADVLRVLTHRITVAPNIAPAPVTTAHPPVIAVPTPAPAMYARALSAESPSALKHNTPKHHVTLPPTPSCSPSPDPPPSCAPIPHRADAHTPDIIVRLDLLPSLVMTCSTEAALFHTISDVMDEALDSVPAISGHSHNSSIILFPHILCALSVLLHPHSSSSLSSASSTGF
ncbi:hypothetical protein C8J57DRAFT_1533032 [Mycena rebaudengoi]|nr:hypothetical protein C8J57DRAFT_1533032 [Mycena rebaudengoi]